MQAQARFTYDLILVSPKSLQRLGPTSSTFKALRQKIEKSSIPILFFFLKNFLFFIF